MLVELEIENLALIRAARIGFSPRLNVLTGATGAGKTLVLRALDLVRGQRAERAQVREGAAECTVSALLRLPPRLVEETRRRIAPVPLQDGELLLARTLGQDGASRCYMNGRLVPLAALREAGARLIDVLGQGEARLLADQEHRAGLVDAFGGLGAARAAYQQARARAAACGERRDRLHAETRERRQRLDLLRFQDDEIRAAAPEPGELERLGRELDVHEAAAELQALCTEGLAELYEADDSMFDRLARLERRAGGLSGGARDLLQPALTALDRAAREIEEAVAGLRAALEGAAAEPARHALVTERLDALRRLCDRYGPGEKELFARRAAIAAEISRLEQDEDETAGADREAAAALSALAEQGEALDRARRAAGERLAAQAQERLRALGMEAALFTTELARHAGEHLLERARPTGLSSVDFLLAANPGHPAQPLAKVASGGESARIALALRMTLSSVLDAPVMVFDEIESGVGARLGEVVGRSLKALAGERQVIVVTHLPQVAACADNHLHVARAERGGATETTVGALHGKEREAEIAAMLRGSRAGGTTQSEARSILKQAREET
ncbi:MAG: AAA family ATPase [Planctomycetes bacterium]|nr:AAA family ATPase [Planctomycetota bacterium]